MTSVAVSLVTLVVLLCPSLVNSLKTDLKYGVIFDADIHETYVRVYSYQPKDTALGFENMTEVVSSRVTPGIALYSHNVSLIAGYLQPLVDVAKGTHGVPLSDQASTPVCVFATAGMRFESLESKLAVMSEVRRLMNDSDYNPFNYSAHPDIQVLSGEEEGAYAWVALNYLNGFFDSSSPKPANESVGVMDLGLGSTQIAFIPTTQALEKEYSITIAKVKYDLYVSSYLNFGIEGIQRQVADHLAAQGFMDNPCVLADDIQVYRLENGTDVFQFGLGIPIECMNLIMSFVILPIGSEHLCQPKPCAVESTYQPLLPNLTFFAIGSFEDAPRNLGIVGADDKLDIVTLMTQGFDFCVKPLQQAEALGHKSEEASTTCVMSMYTPTLLHAFGVSDKSDVRATSKLNGQLIDWTMGALITKISDQIAEVKPEPVHEVPFALGHQAIPCSCCHFIPHFGYGGSIPGCCPLGCFGMALP